MKKILRKIILSLIVIVSIYFTYGFYKESKIRLVIEEDKVKLQKVEAKIEIDNIKKAEVPSKFLGYEVAAKLVIPEIELETNILKKYTEDGLDVCATKFWGPEPNEVGNFCIVGHNYDKENMFNDLIDLEIGSEIKLIDNINGEKLYEVYDIYKVKPENINPLNQETDGKRIITLITCVNYSNTRLIVQAVEK